jgi:hypothetical protein
MAGLAWFRANTVSGRWNAGQKDRLVVAFYLGDYLVKQPDYRDQRCRLVRSENVADRRVH